MKKLQIINRQHNSDGVTASEWQNTSFRYEMGRFHDCNYKMVRYMTTDAGQ